MQTNLDEAISAIYEAATGENSWSPAAAVIAATTGAAGVLLSRQEGIAREPVIVATHAWKGRPGQLPAALPPPGEMRRWTMSQSNGGMIGGLGLGFGGADGQSGCLLLTEDSANLVNEGSALALAPHLRRAAQIAAHGAGINSDIAAFSYALDCLTVPAFVLSGNCDVRCMNRAGARLAQRGPAISIKDGKFAARRRHENVTMRKIMADVAEAGAGAHKIVNLRSRQGSPVISVVIARIANAAETTLLVLVSDLMSRRRFNLSFCATQFGLTPAETRVAAAIAEGSTLNEIAESTKCAIGTVRVHLRRIMAKTGAHSQAQLVGLLFQSLGMFELPEPIPA